VKTVGKAAFTPDTSVPDEQLVAVYTSTDTSSKQCSTRGHKWITLKKLYSVGFKQKFLLYTTENIVTY